jgi:hypothetical protein
MGSILGDKNDHFCRINDHLNHAFDFFIYDGG